MSYGTLKSSDSTLANALLSYMTLKDDTSGNFGRPFWGYSLFCSTFEEMSGKTCLRARESYAVLKRAIAGSRPIGSRSLLYSIISL